MLNIFGSNRFTNSSCSQVQMQVCGSKNRVIVNGKEYILPSGDVSIVDGKVFLNGREFVDTEVSKQKGLVKIEIHSDSIKNVNCRDSLEIHGNVSGEVEANILTCNDITSDGMVVKGNLTCGDITSGSIKVSGNVVCGKVHGNLDCRGNTITG